MCEQVGVPVPDLGISLAGGGVVDCVRGLVGATPECRDCVESLVCCVTDSCRWGGLAPSLPGSSVLLSASASATATTC